MVLGLTIIGCILFIAYFILKLVELDLSFKSYDKPTGRWRRRRRR